MSSTGIVLYLIFQKTKTKQKNPHKPTFICTGFRTYLSQAVYFSWLGENVPIDLKVDDAEADTQSPALFVDRRSDLADSAIVWEWGCCHIIDDTESVSGSMLAQSALILCPTMTYHVRSRTFQKSLHIFLTSEYGPNSPTKASRPWWALWDSALSLPWRQIHCAKGFSSDISVPAEGNFGAIQVPEQRNIVWAVDGI